MSDLRWRGARFEETASRQERFVAGLGQRKKSMFIVIAGKGSAGKSTIAALALDWLVRQGCQRPLALDADPHQSLCALLGLQPPATLGALRSQFERALLSGRDPALRPEEDRQAFAERLTDQALYAAPGFDLLALGRWELPGSQCAPNQLLGAALARLLPRYPRVLADHEAGIEHIGRLSRQPIDRLVLVATPEALSLDVAERVLAHAQLVGRPVRAAALLLNRVQSEDLEDPVLAVHIERLARAGAPLLGALPESAGLRALSRAGAGPRQLPAGDPWRRALLELLPSLLPSLA